MGAYILLAEEEETICFNFPFIFNNIHTITHYYTLCVHEEFAKPRKKKT
jgi:hypothetical protein